LAPVAVWNTNILQSHHKASNFKIAHGILPVKGNNHFFNSSSYEDITLINSIAVASFVSVFANSDFAVNGVGFGNEAEQIVNIQAAEWNSHAFIDKAGNCYQSGVFGIVAIDLDSTRLAIESMIK
jgi:hypothetical protein